MHLLMWYQGLWYLLPRYLLRYLLLRYQPAHGQQVQELPCAPRIGASLQNSISLFLFCCVVFHCRPRLCTRTSHVQSRLRAVVCEGVGERWGGVRDCTLSQLYTLKRTKVSMGPCPTMLLSIDDMPDGF